jgi:hypothetical protein
VCSAQPRELTILCARQATDEAALLSRIEEGLEEAGSAARNALVYREGQRAILEEARSALRPLLERAVATECQSEPLASVEGESTLSASTSGEGIGAERRDDDGGDRAKRARVVPFPAAK